MSGTTFFRTHDNPVLTDSVILLQDFLQSILAGINSLSALETTRTHSWNDEVSKMTLNISQFVEITTLISQLMMKYKYSAVPGVKESHVHLLFIMKAMNQAAQKEDQIVLEELIKYELKDNLTQWKIDIIPHIKRLLNL